MSQGLIIFVSVIVGIIVFVLGVGYLVSRITNKVEDDENSFYHD